jgi:hypothetical protein
MNALIKGNGSSRKLTCILAFLVAGVVADVGSGFAQTLSIQSGSAIGETQPDSIVQIAAESQGLAQVAPADLPIIGGTFWWVMPGGNAVPTPCPPQDLSAPIYQVADGQFLVDETGGQVVANPRQFGLQAQTTSSTVASALATQADAVINLITQIQTRAANQQARATMQALGMDVPSPGGDGSGDGGDGSSPMFSSSYSIDTNGLWLEITNVSGGWSYLNLHNGTNHVYAIWSTTNLVTPFTNWLVETEVWPTNGTVIPTVTPFSVQNLNRQNLFLRAEDWTGVTQNGNTTPCWWFWEYFGTLALSDTNLDSQGYTLLFDYTNGLDPNVISFSIAMPNNYVNTNMASVPLIISSGIPYYETAVVDSTNFASVAWSNYTSSNITVNLGPTGGWHTFWIGLKGLPPDATQTWQPLRLNLICPPVLVLTNPVSNIVSVPVIQIYGYCQDILASLCYDVSNATGLATNQPAEATGKYYDTNGNATVYFECLDVPLTPGSNTITIHATDLVGDTTTTNFNFTLDYSSKTNPPLVQITWPQAGAQLSGSNFTVNGWVADPTVTITTQLVLTNGSGTNAFVYTNTYAGEVDRSGNFWLENLPLQPGTNTFAIAVRDAVGNTSMTNLSVMQSFLVLAINPVTDSSQLWQATVNVTGTISDPTYAVWINGVKGTNYENGTWAVFNVPPGGGGTATFTATAYAPNEQQPDGSYGN